MSEAEREAVALLDRAWNAAYKNKDWAGLERVLAEDFTAYTAEGQPIGRAALLEAVRTNPEADLEFGVGEPQVFGDTATVQGSLQVTSAAFARKQRFMRVYARRGGVWQAVAVQVYAVEQVNL